MCLLCDTGRVVAAGSARLSLRMLHSAVYSDARSISQVNQQFACCSNGHGRQLYLKFRNKAKRAPHCNVSPVLYGGEQQITNSLRLYIRLRRTERVRKKHPPDNLSITDCWTLSGCCIVEKEISDLPSVTMTQLLERLWLK